jgi:hypothetical protein
LKRIAHRTVRVSVRQVNSKAYRQAELVDETANAMIRNGHPIVVPFDCDEFWNLDARGLVLMSAAEPELLFKGYWVNFVQSRECGTPGRFSLLNARYRAPMSEDADQIRVTSFTRSFVCHPATKVAFKTQRAVAIERGQHGLIAGPQRIYPSSIEIFHLPLRSRGEIVKRGLNYEPRRMPLRSDPKFSWQSAFHRDVVTAGKVDDVWAACSSDKDGILDLYGKPLPLIPDDRLRRTFLQAAWYLFKNYRLVAFRTPDQRA